MPTRTPTLDVLDESFDASEEARTSAFRSTWDALAHGKTDVVDLADGADALYPTHDHLAPARWLGACLMSRNVRVDRGIAW